MAHLPPTFTALDLFILALVNEGIETLYAFRQEAGLSVGATQPAVRRLIKQRLLAANESGTRGKQTYSLTTSGKKTLAEGWSRLASSAPARPLSDAETILRLSAMERSRDKVLALLNRAIDDRRARITKLAAPASLRQAKNTAERYRWFVSNLDVHRAEAELETFAAIKAVLSRNRP